MFLDSIFKFFQSVFLSMHHASSAFGILGAVVLIGAIVPPFLDTLKSKKTYGIENKFFIFSILGGFFFFAVAIFLTVDDKARPLGISMIVSNLSSLSMNGYMFKIKRENMGAAKGKGLTEVEYYQEYILPSLKHKMSRSSSRGN